MAKTLSRSAQKIEANKDMHLIFIVGLDCQMYIISPAPRELFQCPNFCWKDIFTAIQAHVVERCLIYMSILYKNYSRFTSYLNISSLKYNPIDRNLGTERFAFRVV